MQGNPHYVEAHEHLEVEAHQEGSYLNPQDAALSVAMIEATLALAFEQRTANLIALWGMNDDTAMSLDKANGMGADDWKSVAEQIRERLGLND